MAQQRIHQWCLKDILIFIQFTWYLGLCADHIPADGVLASSLFCMWTVHIFIWFA